MRLLSKTGLIGVMLGFTALIPVKASATTFTLDCLIASSNQLFTGACEPLSTSLGTVTYNDGTGAGTIDLTGAADGGKVFDLYLNLDPSLTFDPALFSFTGTTANGFIYDSNNLQADGYNIGSFDLDLSFLANSTEPITFTLLYNGSPLNLTFASSPDGGLYAALHAGGYAGGCSQWLGDSTSTSSGSTGDAGVCGGDGGGGGDTVTSPEPASLALFGVGALVAAARARKRKAV
jgi:hypothetical protein